MKTKDFIKMLQAADPSGECYIRMSGGIPYYVEQKQGYWDGPYSYLDENGNYVYSIEGYKVDIYCKDIDDFVCDVVDESDSNNLPSWEDVKNKFIFKLGGYSNKSQRDERSDRILEKAKEAYDDIIKWKKQYFDKSTNDAIKRISEGWRFFQNKKVDLNEIPNMHVYYTWKNIDSNGKEKPSCVHDVDGILHSGLFERIDNNKKEGYYEWKLKTI